jgi:hypothetical protein
MPLRLILCNPTGQVVLKVLLKQPAIRPKTYFLRLCHLQVKDRLLLRKYPSRLRSWIGLRESGSSPQILQQLRIQALFTKRCNILLQFFSQAAIPSTSWRRLLFQAVYFVLLSMICSGLPRRLIFDRVYCESFWLPTQVSAWGSHRTAGLCQRSVWSIHLTL